MAQVLVVDGKAAEARQTGKRRARPLTAAQERLLLLGAAFGLALLIQIAVVWMPMLAAR